MVSTNPIHCTWDNDFIHSYYRSSMYLTLLAISMLIFGENTERRVVMRHIAIPKWHDRKK